MSSADDSVKRKSNAGLAIVSACVAVFIAQCGCADAAATSPASGSGASSSAGSKPSLKAIDPSLAKMDALPKPPQSASPSPNPLGGITGAPISGNKPTALPAAGTPPGWTPYPGASGYPAPAYVQQPPPGGSGYPAGGYPPQYQQPAYQPQVPGAPPGYAGGYSSGGAAQGYPSYKQGYPQQMQASPPGYPSIPRQAAPQYGGGYGGGYQQMPAVSSPPGYPSMPPQQPSYSQYNAPPGIVQPGLGQLGMGSYQQPGQQSGFPAGRARLGGGHPNLVPQGAPQQSGPGAPGYGGAASFGASPGGYPPQGGGYPPPGGYSQPPGFAQPPGLPQGPPSGSPPGQFASNNFPNPNLIPDFGRPLPLDASSRGPGQAWTTNQPAPGTGYGAAGSGGAAIDPDEARVTRLEKVAFGSTYPEHEVADRVDHLEKEIFGSSSQGDLQSRLLRLENKLGGGGRSSFGSPVRHQAPGQYGSYSGGSPATPSLPQAERAQQIALTTPGDTTQDSAPSTPPGAASGSSDDDEASPVRPDSSDTFSSDDSATPASGESDDDSASPSTDTTDGVSTGAGKGSGSSDLKAMASAKSSASKSPETRLRIPFDKSAGDYSSRISRFVNNSAARWTRFPVRVRLPDDATAEWRKLMESAMEKWGRYIPMKKASQQESADIEVSFVNHLTPRVLGVTRLTVGGGRMKVFVYMLRPNYYPAIAEKTLAHAFIHELGHAIGIFGHSDKPTDAMYRFEIAAGGKGKLTQEKLGNISSRDINTLKLIYDADPLPDDFNLTAPQEWSFTHSAS